MEETQIGLPGQHRTADGGRIFCGAFKHTRLQVPVLPDLGERVLIGTENGPLCQIEGIAHGTRHDIDDLNAVARSLTAPPAHILNLNMRWAAGCGYCIELKHVGLWRRTVVEHRVDLEHTAVAHEIARDRQRVPRVTIGQVDGTAVGKAFKVRQRALPAKLSALQLAKRAVVYDTVRARSEIGNGRIVAAAQIPRAV